MENNLKKLAQKALSLTSLMDEREKIETSDIIKYHKDGITITDFDTHIPTENGDTVVYIFEEEPDKFAFGGKVLQKLFDSLIFDYAGDINALKADMKECGGLKIKLKSGKTKKGLPITMVEVL